MFASINEKERIVNMVFLSKIREKSRGKLFVLDGKGANIRNPFVRGSTAAYSQNLLELI